MSHVPRDFDVALSLKCSSYFFLNGKILSFLDNSEKKEIHIIILYLPLSLLKTIH